MKVSHHETHRKVKEDGLVELFEKGNGLQFIKIGAEDIRLSKGMEKGTLKVEV